MTIYIAHRQNNLKRVKYKNNSFFDGIEIDVRSDTRNIILNHDPFKKSLILFKNLKTLEKFFLIIDVKSTGICRKIYNVLKKKHKNFLFLNLIQSEFIDMLKKGYGGNLMLRFSSYENFNLKNKNFKKIKWIWFDFFDERFISPREFTYFKKFKKKICITSPDLLGFKTSLIKKYIKHLKKNKIKVDMVCAKKKNIDIWKKFY